ncbi:pentapeptide repeat-containing protein [Actinokineospora sp. 24-640]
MIKLACRVGAALAAVLVAVCVWAGWLSLAALGQWVLAHAVPVAVTVLALVVVVVVGRSLKPGGDAPAARSGLGWPMMLGAAVVVALVGWVAVEHLLAEADQAGPAARPGARVEAIKTGLAAAAGAGAVFALLLAVRRQWHQETSAVDTVHDATERRITDLYTKAVEQLGSDKAAVRLGGLYALQRLGEGSLTQRETILNVICAYLRMPVPTLPTTNTTDTDEEPAPLTPEEQQQLTPEEQQQHQQRLNDLAQEQQVRLTAQRILTRHRQPGPHYWETTTIDLTGANLAHADLAHADLTGANLAYTDLTGADLTGSSLTATDLTGAYLTGAYLTHANLTDANLAHAGLTGAVLGNANLTHAKLTHAGLIGANLSGTNLADANLYYTDLTDANLISADLTDANLTHANFTGADLSHADLIGTHLDHTKFTGANLNGAHLEDTKRNRANLTGAMGVPLSGPIRFE